MERVLVGPMITPDDVIVPVPDAEDDVDPPLPLPVLPLLPLEVVRLEPDLEEEALEGSVDEPLKLVGPTEPEAVDEYVRLVLLGPRLPEPEPAVPVPVPLPVPVPVPPIPTPPDVEVDDVSDPEPERELAVPVAVPVPPIPAPPDVEVDDVSEPEP